MQPKAVKCERPCECSELLRCKVVQSGPVIPLHAEPAHQDGTWSYWVKPRHTLHDVCRTKPLPWQSAQHSGPARDRRLNRCHIAIGFQVSVEPSKHSQSPDSLFRCRRNARSDINWAILNACPANELESTDTHGHRPDYDIAWGAILAMHSTSARRSRDTLRRCRCRPYRQPVSRSWQSRRHRAPNPLGWRRVAGQAEIGTVDARNVPPPPPPAIRLGTANGRKGFQRESAPLTPRRLHVGYLALPAMSLTSLADQVPAYAYGTNRQ